jgi:putative flippase GtrA
MKKMTLALKYTLFAVVATFANILSQDLSVSFYQGQHSLTLSILIGTAVGLGVKYFLDKKYIFYYQTQNMAHDTQLFILYTVMGVFTTLIFWGFELLFQYLYNDKTMRFIGAIIGLSIGYVIKYRLDKHFVFVKSEC